MGLDDEEFKRADLRVRPPSPSFPLALSSVPTLVRRYAAGKKKVKQAKKAVCDGDKQDAKPKEEQPDSKK